MGGTAAINGWRKIGLAMLLCLATSVGHAVSAAAQAKPEGEMRFAVYVTIAPAWLDPGETGPGNLTPFWMMYALHDALVKPMPGNLMAPSLAESWTESPDKLVYEFKLRKGVKFHNSDAFTAEDVKFSFDRAKGAQLKQKVKDVVVVDPHTVRFVLHEPWPDFMTVYGTLWGAAAWITPKNYFEKVGPDGFKKQPIGLGPYKFVSMTPGIELVMEANEDYWRKVPSIKRIVYISVPEATTRLAMLKRGEVDVAYLLDGQLGESIQNDSQVKLAFSGGISRRLLPRVRRICVQKVVALISWTLPRRSGALRFVSTKRRLRCRCCRKVVRATRSTLQASRSQESNAESHFRHCRRRR